MVSATAPLAVARRPRAFVRVKGTQAGEFLQRMVSNDVEALGVGEACDALLLTAKGRVIAMLRVLRRGEDDYLFVLVPAGRRFDWGRLRTHLGVRRLTLPDADEARAATGYERYTITPFGAARSWPVIVDAPVMDEPVVSVGGGGFGINVHLTPSDLVAALEATVVEVSDAEGAPA